jgi:pyruvate,water dikinase
LSGGTAPGSPLPQRARPSSCSRGRWPAWSISSRSAYEVQPGEILVCRETDPGWTALFVLAAGLVLDTFAGGMLSHAAIVAREYQLRDRRAG